jgi:hypothetical protein
MPNPNHSDNTKALKACDENNNIFNLAFTNSEIRCFQQVSTVTSNRQIGLDMAYFMLYIMNQYI